MIVESPLSKGMRHDVSHDGLFSDSGIRMRHVVTHTRPILPADEYLASCMDTLTPGQLLAHRQCRRRLWLSWHQPALEDAPPWHQRRDSHAVQDAARRLYPEGSNVSSLTWPQSVRQTTAALGRRPRPILNAAVEASGLHARVDLLLPLWRGHRLVKLTARSQVDHVDLESLAIQTWAARQAQWTVARNEVAHIDVHFLYPGKGDYRGLFVYQDVTRDVRALEGDVPAWLHAARATLLGTEPELPPGPQCHSPEPCPFRSHCGSGPKATPPCNDGATQPPRRSQPRREFPAYFLTLATLAPAVPIWEGLPPYRHLPLLWSCQLASTKAELQRKEFISDGSTDTRRVFAYSLLQGIGNTGAVWVANEDFVRERLQELAGDFPDLASALSNVADRLALCADAQARAAHDLHLSELQDYYAQLIDDSLPGARRRELQRILPDLAEKATLALALVGNTRR